MNLLDYLRGRLFGPRNLRRKRSRVEHARLVRAAAKTIEQLERRCMLTTFYADISVPAAPQQATHAGATITAYFTTTGGTADGTGGWSGAWGDGFTFSFKAPTGSQTASCTHTYPDTTMAYTITATATSNGGASCTATEALSNTFGQFPNGSTPTYSGMTTATPAGGSGDLSGKSMVLDDQGRAYVATPYSGQIAITRFTAAGIVDSTWGPNSNGMYPIPAFDGGSDTPTALYFATIGGVKYLAVAGKGANGFAVALFDLGQPTPLQWSVPQSGTLVGAGAQANAVYIDRNGDVLAAGTFNGHMVVIKLAGGDNGGTLMSWGDNNTGMVTVPSWPSSTGASGNAIDQLPFESGLLGTNDLIVGGWESSSYCRVGGCCTACDWAMIALTDDTGVKDGSHILTYGNGCCNINFGSYAYNTHSINQCNGSGYPSTDSINGFDITYDTFIKIIPVGVTNYNNGACQVAVGCFVGTGQTAVTSTAITAAMGALLSAATGSRTPPRWTLGTPLLLSAGHPGERQVIFLSIASPTSVDGKGALATEERSSPILGPPARTRSIPPEAWRSLRTGMPSWWAAPPGAMDMGTLPWPSMTPITRSR